ncbi:MAG: hypothetical protein WBG76_09575, partial [Ornithinimicrobium sp.]
AVPDDGSPDAQGARAVLVAARLPRRGAMTTVHLVSVESRYRDSTFDVAAAPVDGEVLVVSLYNWRFSCPQEEVYRVTTSTVQAWADSGLPSALSKVLGTEVIGGPEFVEAVRKRTSVTIDPDRLESFLRPARFRSGGFRGLLLGLDHTPGTLRLPDSGDTDLDRTRATGHIPLKHSLRGGEDILSFYRGPLAPGPTSTDAAAEVPLPVHTADRLLRYDPTIGMLDVSYATAWQLGRLLSLQNKTFSHSLFVWKQRERAESATAVATADGGRYAHLPFGADRPEDARLPKPVRDGLDLFRRLDRVPHRYLVPDEGMLPAESIRFFTVDPRWIACLLDGAMAVGRVDATTSRAEQLLHEEQVKAAPTTTTGVLLNSALVAGWPDLLLDARDRDGTLLPLLRADQPSPAVKLWLFEGQVDSVDIHQRPEAPHFGLDPVGAAEEGVFAKQLRDAAGRPSGSRVEQVKWRQDGGPGVVDLTALAENMRSLLGGEPLTSADFGLQMIEGVELVTFTADR